MPFDFGTKSKGMKDKTAGTPRLPQEQSDIVKEHCKKLRKSYVASATAVFIRKRPPQQLLVEG
jgi:hypothetical protein